MALPLDGVRVLDLTTTIYGPYAAQMLGDFGADVIKVESPAGDPVRQVGPARSPGMGPVFLGSNRNKRSVVLDLKEAAHKAALWSLIGRADILVHNMRGAKIAALGFGPDEVLKAHPEIIYAGLHGYGEAGPYADRPAYDDVIQGEAGMTDLFRRRGEEPALMPTIAADKTAATMAVGAILAAYTDRLRNGRGRYVEIPMFEAMVSYTFVEHQYGAVFQPPETAYGYPRALSPFRKPHRTADGHVCMLAYTDRQWASFWRLTTRPELADDPRFADMATRIANIGALYQAVGEEMPKRTSAEWLALFVEGDIPAGPARTLEEVRDDPHLASVGFFQPFEHETEGALEMPSAPWRFDRERTPIRRGPPRLGADTEAVLREAGVGEETIAEVMGSVRR